MDNNGITRYQKIHDFDIGIGGSDQSFIRLVDMPVGDIISTEFRFFTWLLLEQECSSKTEANLQAKQYKNNLQLQLAYDSPGPGGDTTDATSRQIVYDRDGLTKRNVTMKHAERLLRAVGVSLPFEQLTEDDRAQLFRLFYSQTKLLRQEQYSSLLTLYEALRKRSKFREEFAILDTLGDGQFGVVYAVTTKEANSSNYAMKQIRLSSFDAYDDIMMIVNESMILRQLGQHPNIVSYVDAWLEVHEGDTEPLVPVFFLQMELGHINLSRWRDENPQVKLSAELVFRITKELLNALEWIHTKKCLHLDINPRNILWSDVSCSSVKMADFGLAVCAETCNDSRGRGTFPYYAPENCLTAKSDIYSMGVTIFELSQNMSTKSELVGRIRSNDLMTKIPFLDKVIPSMLSKHAGKRPTISEILKTLELDTYASDEPS